MYRKSKAPKRISILLLIQSASLVGLLSIHKFPHIVRAVGRDLHSTVTSLTEAASLMIAISLTLIARGISQRRKRAWIMAITLQSMLIMIGFSHNLHRYLSHRLTSHLVFGAFGISHLIFEILVLTSLLIWRKTFFTVTNPHTRKSDLVYFFSVSTLSFLVGFLFVYLDSRYFVYRPSLLQSAEIVLKGFLGISGPIPFSTTRYQDRVEIILGALGLFIAISSILRAMRPIQIKVKQSREARAALSMLMQKYPSKDSLSYFALRDDKSLMWATNNKAAIAYSVTSGTMIASGDPIGDPECWPSAIENFLAEAERHGWTPTVYGCSEYAGEIWQRSTGFEALEIGDEAIVQIADYTIDTPAMKNVRQTINRAYKEGLTTRSEKIRDLDSSTLNSLAEKANQWRRGGDERGFSMALGRFCSPEDSDALITWAELDGEFVGLLQFVPWGERGLSLDLMRRAPQSPPGVNELMIHSTIEFARSYKIEQISLNFATFRSIFERGERLGAGPITRLNHRILKFASRFVQMESLYRFNSKFRPNWEPRFLLFPSVGKLASIAIAVLRIESFLPKSPLKRYRK